MRTAGNTSEADRFDDLAKVALEKQIDYERQAETMQATVAHQTEVVEKLKAGLTQMESKLDELKSKRGELVARAKVVDAQAQVADSMGSIDMMDPTSELSRFEEKIRREEAKVMGQEELASSSLDAQFESLEATADEMEVEARLAALKGESTAAPSTPELDYAVDADVVEPGETATTTPTT
jgi:phage shock protein A